MGAPLPVLDPFAGDAGWDLDFGALVDAGLVEEEDEAEPQEELTRLSRSISGQYVELVATCARAVFRGEDDAALRERVGRSLAPLVRLAQASHDSALREVVIGILALLEGEVPRRLLVARLRDQVRQLARLLSGEDAERLRTLVEVDHAAFPLADALVEVRGIGPRRLQRLYCAGLVTVEALVDADPDEVALVVGVPRELAADVVVAARDFDRLRREELAADLRRRTAEATALVRWLQSSGRHDAELTDAVRAAVASLRGLLPELDPPKPTEVTP